MSDFTPETEASPSLAAQLLASLIRSWSNALAGVLLSIGAIQEDQQSQAALILVGLLTWSANYAWSVIQKRTAAKRLKAAIAAPAGQAS